MKRVLVVAAFAAILAGEAKAIAYTGSIEPEAWPVVAKRGLAVYFTITNTAGTSLKFAVPGRTVGTLTVSPDNGTIKHGGVFPGTANYTEALVLEPGKSHTFFASVYFGEAGTYSVSFSVNGWDSADATYAFTGSRSILVEGATAVETLHPLKEGEMEVRNNVIKIRDLRSTNMTVKRALVVLKGKPGGKVSLTFMGPSGRSLDRVKVEPIGTNIQDGGGIILNGDGVATVAITGWGDGSMLGTGVYWIVARGAVNSRKQVLVLASESD